MNTASRVVAILIVGFGGGASTLAGQGPQRPAVYTAEQAEAGRVAVEKNSFGACTSCHSIGLTGRNGEANDVPPLSSLPADHQTLIINHGGTVPALVGPAFRARWAGRTTKDLTGEFRGRFEPPLTEETRLNIIAYILQANGALPGAQPLTMATDVEIRTLVPAADRD